MQAQPAVLVLRLRQIDKALAEHVNIMEELRRVTCIGIFTSPLHSDRNAMENIHAIVMDVF